MAPLTVLSALLRMARPLILPGGILAYALGLAMGYGHSGSFYWGPAAAGFLVTELANLLASYVDEYADVDTDTLTQRTWFSGGSGVLPAGLVSPRWALWAGLVCGGLAVGFTALFIAGGLLSPHAAWIVGLGLLGGWAYSMPPLCLERRGLGELDNALLGGLLMPLIGYTTQVGRPTIQATLALLPVFTMVLVNLLGVHWADREADAAVGKRSLVVLAGERVRPLHHALIAVSYLLVLGLAGRVLPLPVVVALLATVPVSLWAARTFARQASPLPSAAAMVAAMVAAAVGWIVAGF
jgi:1,4-dihydroxy-2-naphthoate polyprenyltransferase